MNQCVTMKTENAIKFGMKNKTSLYERSVLYAVENETTYEQNYFRESILILIVSSFGMMLKRTCRLFENIQ